MKARLLETNLGCVHTIADILSRQYEKLSGIVSTPIRYVTLHFRDQCEAASLRYRQRSRRNHSCYA